MYSSARTAATSCTKNAGEPNFSVRPTGVTRGRRLVVLIGQTKALGIAVRGGAMKPRWTKLREWLT
jgi:hypothetical protein